MNSSSRAKFSLKGPSITLDQRIHAARGDLADIALAGQLFAPHYAKPMPMQCAVASTMLFDASSGDGKPISQLLLGEEFMVVDMSGGWSWGYCRHDHYVGYVPDTSLTEILSDQAGGIVSIRSATLVAEANEHAAIVGNLAMGAVARGERHGAFTATPLGFVHNDALDRNFADHVAVAEALVDVPYVWGGRAGDGIDCSGLVQLSLALTGNSAPRDSDQQQDAIGSPINQGDALTRGDFIFFPGHVGMMTDDETLIHATMHWQRVAVEPLSNVIARFNAEHDNPVLARKRLA
jgi:hypothetical protein